MLGSIEIENNTEDEGISHEDPGKAMIWTADRLKETIFDVVFGLLYKVMVPWTATKAPTGISLFQEGSTRARCVRISSGENFSCRRTTSSPMKCSVESKTGTERCQSW